MPKSGILTAVSRRQFLGGLCALATMEGHDTRSEAAPRLDDERSLYVASNGNDQWSGTLSEPNAGGSDGPLRTLSAARDRIRKARRTDAASAPFQVLLRTGFYPLSETFVLQPEDSGSEANPVVYAAFPGEHPVISGGRKIGGWEKAGGNIWRTEIPEVREGKWAFRQLFVNGQRRQRARTPNHGFYRMKGPISQAEHFQIAYRSDEFKPEWADLGDVEVVGLFSWEDLRMPVKSVDPEKKIATLAGAARPYAREVDARYYIENAPDSLDSAGEWYLDRKTGVLSYWPLRGEDMRSADVVAPALTRLVRFDGNPSQEQFVEHVVLRGLTFRDADWDLGPGGYADVQAAVEIGGAIKLTGARDCTIERCTITGVEGFALDLGSGCRRNRVVQNRIHDIGAGAVKLGWGREGHQPPHNKEGFKGLICAHESEVNRENIVSDNEIHDLGIVFPSAVGVWVGQTIGSTISHNHIHDLTYTGISVGWNWTYTPQQCDHLTVEYNHIHDISGMSDLGGIYTLGIQPGTVIRNNLIHDISKFAYGAWGIYLDQSSSYILVEDNVVYRAETGGFHQHYGFENVVRNNIFAFGKEHQVRLSKPEDHPSFTFENNIVYWEEGMFGGGDWAGGAPECTCKSPVRPNDSSEEPGLIHPRRECVHVRSSNNVYYCAGKEDFDGLSFAQWQSRGNDRNSTVADPRFVDPESFDFKLLPDSPALRRGFKAIDLKSVGPRPEHNES